MGPSRNSWPVQRVLVIWNIVFIIGTIFPNQAAEAKGRKATHGCVAQHLMKAGVESASASKYEALFAKMKVSPSYVRQTPAPVFTILMGASRSEAKKITDCFQRTAAASASCKKGLVAGVGCNGRGVCRDLKSSEPFYQCVCRPPYTGVLCETVPNHCKPRNPCANGGVCVTHAKGFTCRCRTGYTGEKCEDYWLSEKSFDKKLAKSRLDLQKVFIAKLHSVQNNLGVILSRTPKAKRYRLILHPAKYTAAQAICKKHGMHLLLPETKSEDTHARQLCRTLKRQYCWLNMDDKAQEGQWLTGNSKPLKYFNWEGLQPGGKRDQNCGVLNARAAAYGSWHDMNCDGAYGVICQAEA